MVITKKLGILFGVAGGALAIGLIALFTFLNATFTEVSLGQYIGLEAEYYELTITDSDVENSLLEEILYYRNNVQITDRPVRNGDIANIDYSGTVDGAPFEYGSDTGYELEVGSGSFMDGFEEQVIGMSIGQTSEIHVTFPDPYEGNPDLSGAAAVFVVTVNSIVGKEVPDIITDDMIAEISTTHSTVSEYREYIRSQLESQAEATNIQNQRNAVWSIISENSTVENPSNEKAKYYSNIYEVNYTEYADNYEMTLSEFVQQYLGMTTEEFNEEKKAYGEASAIRCAITEAIAKEQNITTTSDEYKAYVEKYGYDSDYEKQYGQAIIDDVLYEKVMDFIIDNTTFTVLTD